MSKKLHGAMDRYRTESLCDARMYSDTTFADRQILGAEIERLQTRLADYESDQHNAMCEDCGNEKHCTCVPGLRREVEELRAAMLPIRVYCTASDVPNGRQLVARLANVNDVELLQQNYNFCLSWNMDDEAAEAAREKP